MESKDDMASFHKRMKRLSSPPKKTYKKKYRTAGQDRKDGLIGKRLPVEQTVVSGRG